MSRDITVEPEELLTHARRLEVIARSLREHPLPADQLTADLAASRAEDLALAGERLVSAWARGLWVLTEGLDQVVSVLSDAGVAYTALDEAVAERFGG